MMRLHKLQPLVVTIMLVMVLFPLNVSGHTPSIITSNLSPEGPIPSNITETTEFYEGDSVYFRMGDSSENVTMRVSIDLHHPLIKP